jgi:hypothetical protein
MIIERASIIRFMTADTDDILIMHADNCGVLTGNCTCQPEIRLVEKKPTVKKRQAGRSRT